MTQSKNIKDFSFVVAQKLPIFLVQTYNKQNTIWFANAPSVCSPYWMICSILAVFSHHVLR